MFVNDEPEVETAFPSIPRCTVCFFFNRRISKSFSFNHGLESPDVEVCCCCRNGL